jgi:phenylacetate-CoA ligase
VRAGMDLMGALARSVFLPLVVWKGRSQQLAYARRYEQTQFHSPERLADHQLECLRRLIGHAMLHCAFHRRRFEEAGLDDPAELRSLDELRRLPTLPKEAVRERSEELTIPDPSGVPLREKRTSGSTGVPLRIQVNEDGMQHKAALTWRHNAWAGYRVGDLAGSVWGDMGEPALLKEKARRALLDRVEVLDSQKMDDARMAAFTAALRRRRIRTLVGHAQPLCVYAAYVLERGIEALPVRAVIPTAMVLHAGQRELLERAFSAAVFERYGSEETSIIASECPAHRGMHIAAEGLIVEFLKEGRAAEPGEEAEIVVTDLVNYGMPLIRYEIGDVGVRGPDACPCGRGLPMIERVRGRIADTIVTPEGRIVSGISITDHIVDVEGVRQVQIVQESRDELVFRIVKDEHFSAEGEAVLRGHCRRIFGDRMRVRCDYVDRIPAGPRGKYPLCVSRLGQPRGG